MAATIHALSLPRDIKRAKMFFLRVKVSYRPDHGGVPSKFFRVNDAFLIDIEEAKKLGSVWTRSVEHVDGMRAEGEALRRGSVAAVALECAPLAMQIVPFGSLKDLSPLKIQQNWKEILIRYVENGKKMMRFEMV
jgi:splicing suppressor protein 51